ncbi:unnamed protein product [Parnassius apollo]|uniref:(apollo) hypothetical protein n=1 Tax=Parnassius apollo TaxID=110799 RepID=A0A8S3X1P7_PARAO|nr:unnamed protein product [Parnassius apollo]
MALTQHEAEVKDVFLLKLIECNAENPVNVDEINMLKNHTIPESKTAKCLLACVFKKTSWMDEKGLFVMENAVKLTEEKHPKNSPALENSKKLFELCTKVNEEIFNDGEEDCERAAKLARCLIENATKLGFQLK